MKKIREIIFVIVISILAFQSGICQNSKLPKEITFVAYPDFPDAHSTWGDIGYNPVNNAVYIGVTNHRDKVGWYTYYIDCQEMQLEDFIGDMAHLRSFQWQGKIHTKIVADQDGMVYFGTDGGESRQEYLMNNPHGYSGGYIMKWDPEQKQLTNLGMPMQYESIKDVDINPRTGMIYAISYPQAHFLTYQPSTNTFKDHGRLASAHVPRIIFTDQWGNCYYVDWRQRLVKYESSAEKLIFAKESLPAFSGTPGSMIVTGITAFAKDQENGIIYLVTYGAKVLAFTPQEEGMGTIKDLGPVYDLKDKLLYGPYVPNLNLGNNGKLYYFIGGHGNYVKKDITVLIELDPDTKEKRIVHEFPTSQINEVTGSGVKDKDGNMYFAGRKNVKREQSDTENQATVKGQKSVPFMIIYNPSNK